MNALITVVVVTWAGAMAPALVFIVAVAVDSLRAH